MAGARIARSRLGLVPQAPGSAKRAAVGLHPTPERIYMSETPTVRVYRVKNSVSGDYIATSFKEACEFLMQECDPENEFLTDPEHDGHEATIISEHWTQEEIDACGEWSP
jgi:hypothetical protein